MKERRCTTWQIEVRPRRTIPSGYIDEVTEPLLKAAHALGPSFLLPATSRTDDVIVTIARLSTGERKVFSAEGHWVNAILHCIGRCVAVWRTLTLDCIVTTTVGDREVELLRQWGKRQERKVAVYRLCHLSSTGFPDILVPTVGGGEFVDEVNPQMWSALCAGALESRRETVAARKSDRHSEAERKEKWKERDAPLRVTLDANTKTGHRPLFFASEKGDDSVVSILVKAGAEVDKADKFGIMPLYSAAEESHDTVVSTLLKARAEIDKAEMLGLTPLHAAASAGHGAVVSMLLEAGAEKDKANDCGQTPLFLAAKRGLDAVVSTLLRAGAEVDKADNNGRTPLDIARLYCHEAVIALLLSLKRVQSGQFQCEGVCLHGGG
uniref:Uncharacterized protein n=1 Tax=Chromera velia CCMP2878 TaxID=1169474 RepID=A0A0G4GWB5_9ALVE|eukprot:Cvel_23683.t1-p1 / transcript=Cvel_23683.t1 / gene=Cvel_23683 / organism=Chromera_velia_CCMP2878 / gene_product=Ankyrin-2, putative / transcript_product=Ankyrin-2, putative / location=Cvel_scaffold2469:18406-22733(+) / protein_length=379 / sequence_SO=supercontig / SO=protein_coding / is_pseudo=false